MQIDLSDKLAIVSGSTAGIGFAIASGLAAAGATVVVNGRSQAAVDRAIAAIRDGQPDARVRGVAGDLGTAKGCAAFVAAEPKADILVNNLGIFELKDFFDIEDAEWTRFFEVNVMSGVRLARAYVPGMVERGWGRVVFLSSESALNIPADMIVPFQMDLSQVSNIINRLPTGWICSVSPIPGICAFFCAKYWTDRESELATRVNDGCGGSLGHAACW